MANVRVSGVRPDRPTDDDLVSVVVHGARHGLDVEAPDRPEHEDPQPARASVGRARRHAGGRSRRHVGRAGARRSRVRRRRGPRTPRRAAPAPPASSGAGDARRSATPDLDLRRSASTTPACRARTRASASSAPPPVSARRGTGSVRYSMALLGSCRMSVLPTTSAISSSAAASCTTSLPRDRIVALHRDEARQLAQHLALIAPILVEHHPPPSIRLRQAAQEARHVDARRVQRAEVADP